MRYTGNRIEGSNPSLSAISAILIINSKVDMEDSLFTKIINKDVPAHIIYEDDKTLAFLDIFPIVRGHTLVIPKKQVENLWDLPDEDYQALMSTVKKVAIRIRDVMEPAKVGLKVMGTDVPHAH